ncbi:MULTISPECIES: LysR family transcriptional regulator [unclassified Pseudomonas]|uniref:LysR family transcriptional regulator n=1 Tax=unclassified Pseudomonas TaxID=196821 RepID=UPI0012966841|nr:MULTISPECIES: LysR family transcriptional regulator [unclassified Pseudomonas]MDU7558926.1 LysR family transcriptional regulator [Pseudomonas sp.]MQT40778.1 LysR family transcriptional regulator [Pseudomonas sp. FSL R10-0765]MQT50843.1 LysR family transcriptional regulator [Pseudomonas sp. FSL R10-2398]MQU00712.1 LysR family transcriptional regulator [Pseudomonas sp. FSL R10-2245]MQU10539.1 LysR family transcriptional regulator [Pseudomonas sp. FSL R10-2189]
MSANPFDGIREFVSAAQSLSFTAAALELGVTSSAVGKSVTRLEARLGVKLLHRTTRRLVLTAEGEAYLASCLRVMDELAETQGFLTTGQQAPVGRLRIDLPAAFGRRHILPTLIDMAVRYQQLDLSVSFSERLVDIVNEGVDLVVRIGVLKDDAEIVARKLGSQSLLICATPAYLQAHGTPQAPDDLLHHDCIVGWRNGTRKTWMLKDEKGQTHEHEVRVKHEVGDGEMLLNLTLAGGGLAQLPTWLVQTPVEQGLLVPVLEACAGAEMPIHVIWPRTRYLQPKVRMVVDELLALAQRDVLIFRPDLGPAAV